MSVLVGKPAPDFTVPAVLGDGTIVEAFNLFDAIVGRPAIVFFYPLDFGIVCPTELIALERRMDALQERGVTVVSVSVDSHLTHNAWRNTPIDKGGIGPVRFTMAADLNHDVVQAYGVQSEGSTALRAAFLIDKTGFVRSLMVNDLPLGRNLDELLRLVDALQFYQSHGEVCPAGWKKGDRGITETPEGIAQYLYGNAVDL